MAWTAPRTWVTGEIVTAAQMNEQIRDNMNMLIQKDGSVAFTADQPMGGFSLTGLAASAAAGESVRHEQLSEISGVDRQAAYAEGTNYQNTTGMTVLASITVQQTNSAANGYQIIDGKIGASSPGNIAVAEGFSTHATNGQAHRGFVCFLIPNNYYYRIDTTLVNCAGNTIVIWYEQELHG